MTPQPRITVVIPTYNYAGPVQQAIQSVVSQLDHRSELIVVDDGSTDETATVLARLHFPEGLAVHCARQSNAGPAAARNHGMRLARGEFLLFLDADDQLLPGTLSALQDALDSHPETDMVLGAHLTIDDKGREKNSPPTPVSGTPEQRIRNYLLKKSISVVHGASLFRRSFVEQRPYPEDLRQSEDLPVFAYMVAHSRTTLLPQALVRIVKHSDSLRHDATLSRRTAPEHIARLVFERLPEPCQPLRTSYEAQRLLSTFRTLYLGGHHQQAAERYREAFRRDWRQALRWSYLSKFVRLLLRPADSR
ncbi:glycosyltransferase family 2 protein [Azonexus caeni]|jgi:glycosyltransferase involved in cell wall biosynthesis|uniref:glycosyltransferase family 2 protein n=1 Tax=Azonexus caeni TaxID=266126 RepID=UPI003A8AF721